LLSTVKHVAELPTITPGSDVLLLLWTWRCIAVEYNSGGRSPETVGSACVDTVIELGMGSTAHTCFTMHSCTFTLKVIRLWKPRHHPRKMTCFTNEQMRQTYSTEWRKLEI
jgi:hypothetical protein